MAKRHIVEYFDKVSRQYSEMLSELKDFENECNNNLVEPEQFEQFKRVLEPIKNNYMVWSYVMYLLNLPNREKKVKSVKRRSKHVLDNGGYVENKGFLNSIKNVNNRP
jgi:hypothetical protein